MAPSRGNGGVGAVNGFGCHTDMETHGFVAALSLGLEEAPVSGSEDPLVLNNLVIIAGEKEGDNCIRILLDSEKFISQGTSPAFLSCVWSRLLFKV